MICFCEYEYLSIHYTSLLGTLYDAHLRVEIVLEILVPVQVIGLEVREYRVVRAE